MTTGPTYAIEQGSLGASRLVTVSGEIDLASAATLEEALAKEPSETVIADLSEVGFIDSTGLRSLLAARDTIESEGGRLLLVFEEGPVERILQLTRLHDRFEIYRSADLASEAVG
ncbi:MAG: STAS domain-containing protein [Actinomycetota bacterium]